jgi:hypothetical protein
MAQEELRSLAEGARAVLGGAEPAGWLCAGLGCADVGGGAGAVGALLRGVLALDSAERRQRREAAGARAEEGPGLGA